MFICIGSINIEKEAPEKEEGMQSQVAITHLILR